MRRPVVRTTVRKPVIHNRDHEHGSADPLKIHYEDVGSAGAGGIALPTIKGHYASLSPAAHFVIGSTGLGDDADWTYLYALEHATLLHVDANGLIASDGPDPALYLIVASARFSGLINDDLSAPDAELQVLEDATGTDGLDRQVPVENEVHLQRSYVVAGGPVSSMELRHSADNVTNCEATLSVTLINPGPVAL